MARLSEVLSHCSLSFPLDLSLAFLFLVEFLLLSPGPRGDSPFGRTLG